MGVGKDPRVGHGRPRPTGYNPGASQAEPGLTGHSSRGAAQAPKRPSEVTNRDVKSPDPLSCLLNQQAMQDRVFNSLNFGKWIFYTKLIYFQTVFTGLPSSPIPETLMAT